MSMAGRAQRGATPIGRPLGALGCSPLARLARWSGRVIAAFKRPTAPFLHSGQPIVPSWESVMTKGKAITGTAAATLALLSFAKAAFVREVPNAPAQDAARAWFAVGVLFVCAVLFLIARTRSSY